MIKNVDTAVFLKKLFDKKDNHPWSGLVELTYRCSLDCIHCYCKGSEDKDRELTAGDWKRIFDSLHLEGCLKLTLTGGDPLTRADFLEIYSYAKQKGFFLNIFTNGQNFTKEIISHLVKSPPNSIEITLNSINESTYEAITQKKGSFHKAAQAIRALVENKLPLILKANCLRQNKDEISLIKKWAEKTLGNPGRGKYRFKYDPMIYPRLNGDKTPCEHRLVFDELLEVKKQDEDIWRQYQESLCLDSLDLGRDKKFLYRCTAWKNQFFINPYGRLKFCQFSEKFSVDLKTVSFKEGFYGMFPKLLKEEFKTNSKCKDCSLRPFCYHCPARAYLETGDQEAHVPYYCEMAKETAKSLGVAS